MRLKFFKPFVSSYDKPGLYYVETDQYFPMRGNGWYSHAMINYCIEKCLINVSDIKYVIYSGLSISKEYFNFLLNIFILILANMQKILLIQ